MSDSSVEQRLGSLELKSIDLDDWVERLNAQVYRQQQQIDRLQAEVRLLTQRLDTASPPGFRSLRDEIPPHY